MKKFLSVFLVAGILVACDDSKKSETKTETTTETKADAKGTDADSKVSTTTTTNTSVEVPKFSNDEITKMAQDYAAFMSESASMSSDPAKMEEYTKKATEWGTKMQTAMTKFTPEDVTKWTEFTTALAKAQTTKMTK
jgi:hypothetical protein